MSGGSQLSRCAYSGAEARTFPGSLPEEITDRTHTRAHCACAGAGRGGIASAFRTRLYLPPCACGNRPRDFPTSREKGSTCWPAAGWRRPMGAPHTAPSASGLRLSPAPAVLSLMSPCPTFS